MNAINLIQRAEDSGVVLYLDGETLKARGCRQAVNDLSPELRIHKAEIVALLASARMAAASDPAEAAGVAGSAVTPPAAAADPNAWRVLSAAYHAHHFACHVCIAAGRGAQYGLRCGVGAALWVAYQESP